MRQRLAGREVGSGDPSRCGRVSIVDDVSVETPSITRPVRHPTLQRRRLAKRGNRSIMEADVLSNRKRWIACVRVRIPLGRRGFQESCAGRHPEWVRVHASCGLRKPNQHVQTATDVRVTTCCRMRVEVSRPLPNYSTPCVSPHELSEHHGARDHERHVVSLWVRFFRYGGYGPQSLDRRYVYRWG